MAARLELNHEDGDSDEDAVRDPERSHAGNAGRAVDISSAGGPIGLVSGSVPGTTATTAGERPVVAARRTHDDQ